MTRHLGRGYYLLLPDLWLGEVGMSAADAARQPDSPLWKVERVDFSSVDIMVTCENAPKEPQGQHSTPAQTTTPTTITEAQLQALIDHGVAAVMADQQSKNLGVSVKFGIALYKTMLLHSGLPMLQTTTPKLASCPCQGQTLKKMMTYKLLPRGMIKKIDTECGFLRFKGTDVVALQSTILNKLALMWAGCSYESSKPKTMQEAIEFTTELMDEKTHAYAKRQAEKKRKYDDLSKNNQNQQQHNKRQITGQAYTEGNSDWKPYNGIIEAGLQMQNNNNRINNNNNQRGKWLLWCGLKDTLKYKRYLLFAGEDIRIPWEKWKPLIIQGDGSNQGNVIRLNIISCTETQKYMQKGFPIFLAHVTAKEVKDKLVKK
ncbi:hypothetical protein Tco_0521913 [Tanacetum coccineum]